MRDRTDKEVDVKMARSLKETAIGNLHLREEDAFEFFVAYARYEYAAKVCKLVHQGDEQRMLTINPQGVADRIRASFESRISSDKSLQKAVAYYTAQPPQRQIWDGNGPGWDQPVYQGNDTLKNLLLQLAQARNNLFHGGKGWKADNPAMERDNDLLRHGLVILDAVVNSDDQLFGEFSSFA
ncbi:hypothetical protein CWR43_14150 [Rhizobium sullae]|uniref:RiboL-PSP-HEPN domain-containing protein n=1 Tax=Rhizobium sullae TaxID=50338 RepID=A0A2N0DAR8_RHISU|nr:hypothetical protein [Rhizobium sullae]PKA43186.1 hypothetical protein CWR43_14150 [Rhizobium sullae]